MKKLRLFVWLGEVPDKVEFVLLTSSIKTNMHSTFCYAFTIYALFFASPIYHHLVKFIAVFFIQSNMLC